MWARVRLCHPGLPVPLLKVCFPSSPFLHALNPVNRQQIDDKLSRRHLDLDPLGYFIIYIDKETSQIVAKHYKNTINDKGVACDPETGKPIPCDGSYKPTPSKIYRGYTAKELSVAILEDKATPPPVSMLVHANYLGREFQRAEAALVSGPLVKCPFDMA
eukprot:jgi/Mesvir1/18466/Mv14317-RA.1